MSFPPFSLTRSHQGSQRSEKGPSFSPEDIYSTLVDSLPVQDLIPKESPEEDLFQDTSFNNKEYMPKEEEPKKEEGSSQSSLSPPLSPCFPSRKSFGSSSQQEHQEGQEKKAKQTLKGKENIPEEPSCPNGQISLETFLSKTTSQTRKENTRTNGESFVKRKRIISDDEEDDKDILPLLAKPEEHLSPPSKKPRQRSPSPASTSARASWKEFAVDEDQWICVKKEKLPDSQSLPHPHPQPPNPSRKRKQSAPKQLPRAPSRQLTSSDSEQSAEERSPPPQHPARKRKPKVIQEEDPETEDTIPSASSQDLVSTLPKPSKNLLRKQIVIDSDSDEEPKRSVGRHTRTPSPQYVASSASEDNDFEQPAKTGDLRQRILDFFNKKPFQEIAELTGPDCAKVVDFCRPFKSYADLEAFFHDNEELGESLFESCCFTLEKELVVSDAISFCEDLSSSLVSVISDWAGSSEIGDMVSLTQVRPPSQPFPRHP